MNRLTLLFVLASLAGCTLGSQILDVGKQCSSDSDCSPETECVRADAPSADKVCMPIDDDGGESG